MTGRYDLLAYPVEFVTASKDESWKNLNVRYTNLQPSHLSGQQAKDIYEEIINAKSNEETKANTKAAMKVRNAALAQAKKALKKKYSANNIHDSMNLTRKDLFHAAQSGDLPKVKKCVTDCKMDVNAHDDYFWTPLMMSAYEGHVEVVSFLLAEGAQWTNQIDGSGYDARDLACLGGHSEIAVILMNSERHVRKRKVEECREKALKTIKREKLWCELCKCHYYAPADKDKHDEHTTSTLHLICNKDSTQQSHSHFYISGCNRGYQLLRKDGWDGQSGLGPGKTGQKYPVKTILKRDRLGLGSANGTARVTHFSAYDRAAVRRPNSGSHEDGREWSSKTKRKRHLARKDEEDKQKEIDFRRLFH